MIRWIRSSLKIKLIVMISLILCFMVSVVGLYSYAQTKKAIGADAESFSNQILSQANLNLSRYYLNSQHFFETIRTSKLFGEWLEVPAGNRYGNYARYKSIVDYYIEPFIAYSPEVLSVRLLNANGNQMIYRADSPKYDLMLALDYRLTDEWFGEGSTASTAIRIEMSDRYANRAGQKVKTPILTFAYHANEYNGKGGWLAVDFSLAPLLEILQNIRLRDEGMGMILDASGKIIAHPDTTLMNTSFDKAIWDKLQDKASGSVYIPERHELAVYDTVSNAGWKLVVLVPYEELNKSVYKIRKVILSVAVASLLVCFALVILVSESITRRLKELIRTIRRTDKGDLDVRVNVKGQDEVAELARAYNELLAKIGLSIEELTSSRIMQQQAVLSALQSQINSHFLYNALESINSMAYIEGNKDIGDTAVALSGMLRYAANYRDTQVTLKDEAEHLRNYMRILRIFYGDDIRFDIDIPSTLAHIPCLKTVFQPIVENAVKHGYEATGQPLGIRVRAIAIGDRYVEIHIEDDGSGMTPERLDSIRATLSGDLAADPFDGTSGIGLFNVHSRLRMAYPGDETIGVSVPKSDATGTHIVITIPFGRHARL